MKNHPEEIVSMNAKTLTWADTGEPVKAGDLVEGEEFEVELESGKTKRGSGTPLPPRRR